MGSEDLDARAAKNAHAHAIVVSLFLRIMLPRSRVGNAYAPAVLS